MKKLITLLSAACLVLSLVACGSSDNSGASAQADATAAQSENGTETAALENAAYADAAQSDEAADAADSAGSAAGAGSGSESSEPVHVTLGVTGAFYEDLWQPAADALASEGIELELIQFSDFSLPNNALNSGELDMNAFQHHAYFKNDTSSNGYDLEVLADTFVVTMNLYSNKYAALDDLKAAADSGEKLTVAVPNDATNYGRALIVLRDAGLLTLGEYDGTPLEEDIVDSKVELYLVNASMTYQYLNDVDASVINGNYAASYGVDPASAIFDENIDLSDDSFTCLIAVRSDDIDNPTYKRVAEVFRSDITTKVVNDKFDGFFYLTW